MPELPEVQSFANALNAAYAGRILAGITLRRNDIRFPLDKVRLTAIFAPGNLLARFGREGKQLLIETTDESRRGGGVVSVSLGMSGAFLPADPRAPVAHEHVTLHFQDGDALGFVDPRRFGFWKVRDGVRAPVDLRKSPGANGASRDFNGGADSACNSPATADPLDAQELLRVFSAPQVAEARRSVKDLLMDQRVIGGIGNIYALEALFRAGILPTRPCRTLTAAQWKKLASCLPPLLSEAIAAGGSSISTYRTLHGKQGGFQDLHQVYDRDGEPCRKRGCKGMVVRVVQGGRGSWYCEGCQR